MPKAYQLTINKIDDWGAILEYLQSLTSINYMIACREFAPKTGKEHYHVYIQLKYSMTLSKKKLLSAHIEICKGSPQANIDYIRKQGDILFEEGEPRLGGNSFSIKEIKAMTNEERENLSFYHYNKIQNLKRDELCVLKASEYLKNIQVYYIYGKSGTGKTKYAINAIASDITKYALIKAMDPDANITVVKKDGTLDFDNGDLFTSVINVLNERSTLSFKSCTKIVLSLNNSGKSYSCPCTTAAFVKLSYLLSSNHTNSQWL